MRLKKISCIVFLFVLALFPVAVFSQSGDATQVNLTVTCPNVDCTDEEPPSVTITGCTNENAKNYNPLATVDNGSCRYDIPNVDGLTATYNTATNRVNLSWNNPSASFVSGVRVVKSESTITSEDSGEILYEGNRQSVFDNAVEKGRRYYYGVFVKSTWGEYSSGAIVSVTIPRDEDPLPTDTPPGGGPGGGGDPGGGIFDGLPVIQEGELPQIFAKIPYSDFIISQPGELQKRFIQDGTIRVKGKKNITISIAYDKLPEVLKTIGITIYDPANKNRSFSFILKLNAAGTAYEATISPLPLNGIYPVSIYIIDYQDRTVKKINGSMLVAGTAFISSEAINAVVEKVVAPAAVTSGVAVGLLDLLLSSTHIASLSDLYLLLVRMFGAILGFLGFKKKRVPWGTVYDSVTKRPIDPAYVTVLSGEKETASAITDIDGRFGFFLAPGEYKLSAGKTHYKFPSVSLAGQASDELYGDLYFGDSFIAEAGNVVSKNIPLDPVGFDWNEFVKGKSDFFKVHSARELTRAKIVKTVYGVGFAVTVGFMLFAPSVLNLLILFTYIAIHLFERLWKSGHRVVSLVDGDTGLPMSFAIIRAFLSDLNTEVKHVVADELGRFYILLRPGSYYFTVEEKLPDGSYQKIYQSEPMNLDKGVLKENLTVKRAV